MAEQEKTTEQTPEVEQPVSEPEQLTVEPEPSAEPISDEPGAEVLSEAPAETLVEEVSPRQKLAEEVKAKLLACAEETDCLDTILARFDEMATRLGIPTVKLIDEVFALLTRKEG